MTTTTSRQSPKLTLGGPRPNGQQDKPAPEPLPAQQGWKDPAFVREFARLAALVPPGRWPATLPTTGRASMDPKPLQLGIGNRVAELLPEAERAALHVALGHYTRQRPYLLALAADEAQRWADDGKKVVEAVSGEHRMAAAAMLMSRAVSEARKLGGKGG